MSCSVRSATDRFRFRMGDGAGETVLTSLSDRVGCQPVRMIDVSLSEGRSRGIPAGRPPCEITGNAGSE